MVIKRSAGQEVQVLIAGLDADSEVRRESAAARLAVIGTRAVDRLVRVVQESASARARTGALHALEGIGDHRAVGPAVRSLGDPDAGVVAAAVDLLRRFLRSEHGAATLDRLVALALDAGTPEHTRCAALDALAEMPARVLGPIHERLSNDASERIRQRVTGQAPPADARSELDAIATGGLPEDPPLVRDLLLEAGASAPLPTLHRLIELIRDREVAEQRPERQRAWMAVRGAVHRALAERDSRVALYDLRETLEAAAVALPVDFVAALERVGDGTCLEPIAAAYAAAAGEEEWWKRHLAGAFRVIARREGLSKRHQVMKRILGRWPDVAADLLRRE